MLINENSHIYHVLDNLTGAAEYKWSEIVMTNLDSILKSRNITLPTKFHLVKGMVFPVAMYGCESWTLTSIKKAES